MTRRIAAVSPRLPAAGNRYIENRADVEKAPFRRASETDDPHRRLPVEKANAIPGASPDRANVQRAGNLFPAANTAH
jgi:hypothetical protein